MKQLLLFVWVIFLAAGCKKEETSPKAATELLQGAWHVTSNTYEGYNAANAKVYTNSTQNNATYFIAGQDISISDGASTVPWATYTLSERQNKKYINVAGIGLNATFELTQLSATNMTWVREAQNETYHSATGVRTDPKSITTIQFQR